MSQQQSSSHQYTMQPGEATSVLLSTSADEALSVSELLEELKAWWMLNLITRRTIDGVMGEYLEKLIDGEGPPEALALMKKALRYEKELLHSYVQNHRPGYIPPDSWYWHESVKQIHHFKALLLRQGYDMDDERYFDREHFTYIIHTQRLPHLAS